MAVVAGLAGLGLAGLDGGSGDASAAGDLHLSIKSVQYSSTSLEAPSGTVAIDIRNNDLFWHTFTIDGQNVDERIPVKGHHRLALNLSDGVYHYYCAIPGHASSGMRGTLTVH